MATRRRPAPTTALSALHANEHAVVLRDLLEAHPELRREAEHAARRLLGADTVEAVADDVFCTLTDLQVEDLADRSGRVRCRGYVHENEAAWELIEEAVEPFLNDLRRRASLDLTAAATAVATGIIAGLYLARNPEDGSVIAYAGPDALGELADHVVNEATKLGLQLPADAAANHWPDWESL